ncbi:aspartate aminotransferase family protein [Candidatus Heimdallarchaeota archaeon B3_Heim]|nr:MAG: aspartate aminotransferase family protein [Candidatus Heimdallarchaeota archaeon B3_Heim]
MGMTQNEMVEKNKKYTLSSWKSQSSWNPIAIEKAKGVYLWDTEGKKHLDWSSQLINVNIGHGNQYVNQAIQDQLAKFCYVSPSIATEARARLGEMLNEIVPMKDCKAFFTNGGAEAIENAMKIARLYTGRQKIITRYRSYHGGTFGAMTAGGDPRRLANEPGLPWIVYVHGPYAYRNPIYRNKTVEEGDSVIADLIEETILFEGPQNVAAILLEGYSGSSGIMQGGKVFWDRIQEICNKYNILLIIDEVMSGFGRTGKWFGINHQPQVKPDIMCLAKGITSAYVPLGAAVVSGEIASHFDDNVLWCGLTNSSHTLGCAAAVANIEVYQNDNLIKRSEEMGKNLYTELMKLHEKYQVVGEIRGIGLHYVIELVKNRGTRQPLSPFNSPLTEPMQKVAKILRENGLSTFVRWNWIFCAPPLIITEEQIQEGITIIERALSEAEKYYLE